MSLRMLSTIGCCLALPLLAGAAPPPASAYAEIPSADTGRLSPDGKSVAYLQGAGDGIAITEEDVDSGVTRPIPASNWNPQWVRWKDNQTLLVSLEQTIVLEDRVPAPGVRLVAIAADGSRAKAVVFDRSENPEAEVIGDPGNLVPNIQDDIISDAPDRPDHILVEVPYTDYLYPSLFDVNLWTGEKIRKLGDFHDVLNWVADQTAIVRAGITYSEHGSHGAYTSEIIARRSESDGWHDLPFDADEVAFSATDPTVLYAVTAAPHRLLQLDIATGTMTHEIAHGEITMRTRNNVLMGYSLVDDQGNTTTTYLDPAWQTDATTIAHALKLDSVPLVDRSADGKRITALVAQGSAPAKLWLLDRGQNPADLMPLISDYDDVPPALIATGVWTSFKARDGLSIPLLVTLPVNAAKAPIPFVVMPHGGPSARDDGGFDWMVQFLVSRGYGVLQPQFRGSSGFGADFENKGNRQWGLAMQDDITDATQWLIAQNLADPKKICIVGASYGGYAALEGAVKEPALYACAAAISPVTDLPYFMNDQRDFVFSDSNIPRIGDDYGALEAVSPDRHADKIQIPILLIHGRDDYTVSVRQTEKMEAALKAAGKTEQTIYLPTATHYLEHPADRLAVLDALEAFLRASLGS